MSTSTSSILAQELAPLEAQIEHYRKKREAVEEELRVVEDELSAFSAERDQFDALRDVCNALDKLGELKAEELFWEGLPEVKDVSGHLESVRNRVARFEEEISVVLEKQKSLQEKIGEYNYELFIL
ncbi:MAG: hypothetical protein GWO23_21980, partial [Gammaproteobacteria bacterium]|nr:hypothetical protein [Gammaproteobacteria bacterium]